MNQNVEHKIDKILSSGFKINVGDILNKAGDIFKGIAGYAILALVIYYILSGLISFLIGIIFPGSSINYQELIEVISTYDQGYLEEYLMDVGENSNSFLTILSYVISFALYPIILSIYTMAHKFDTNKKVEFSDLFIHYRDGKFVKIFLVSIITYVLISISFVLCIIPGFIVLAIWLLAIPLIILGDASVGEALNYSMKLAFKDFGSFLLFVLLLIGVWIIGALLCCIGLIVAVPFGYVLGYVLYKEVIGFPEDKSEIDEIGKDIYKDNPYMN